MGICISADEQFDYEAELRKQTTPVSIVVESKDDDGLENVGPIRRNPLSKDKLCERITRPDIETKEELDTLYSSFSINANFTPDAACLGTRPIQFGKPGEYKWATYKEVSEEAVEVGAGLKALGIGRQETVGICSANRHEWTVSALGAYSQGQIIVALYDTLSENALDYIINHAETKVVIISKAKMNQVLPILDKCDLLETVIQFDKHAMSSNDDDNVDDDTKEKVESHGKKFITYSELRQLGRDSGDFADPASPEETAMYMYTSGTTGTPKGVVLSHANIVSCVSAVATTPGVNITSADCCISYLPLAHIFETAIQTAVFSYGASIGYFAGNVKTLVGDIQALKPTIFPGVPRVFSRIYDKVMNGLANANGIKRCIVVNKLQNSSKGVRRGNFVKRGEGDDKIFAKIREQMGLTNCRLVVTGAAPCPPYLMEFLRVVVTDKVIQGYGMTETAAAVSVSAPADHCLGHVGAPLSSSEIRLQSVEEMGYTVEVKGDDDFEEGEILARGPSIFKGYYKNEEATTSTLEPSGWIHTGDIGRWNKNGTLSIIDRKKNMFKLSQGEYVASEKIEGVYVRAPMVGQIFIYGNSYKPFLLGVVSPEPELTTKFMKEKGWWGNNTDEYLSPGFVKHFSSVASAHRSELEEAIKEQMKEQATLKKLLGFEKARDICLETEIDELGQGFNVANDCMTPTFKLRRPFLLKRYQEQLRELYSKCGEPPKPDEKW